MWHTDNAPAAQASRKPDSFFSGKYKVTNFVTIFHVRNDSFGLDLLN